MVKKLQRSLAAAPAAHYRSLIMHWLDSATIAIYTLLGTCGDSAHSFAVECTKLVDMYLIETCSAPEG